MSTSIQTVADLAATESTAAAHTEAAVAWMLESGVVTPGATDHARLRHGPRIHDALTPESRWIFDSWVARQPAIELGVEVSTTRRVWYAGENYTEPDCARCATPFSTQIELIGTWWETGVEPTARCTGCGFADLVGNWLQRRHFGIYVACAAIAFEDWPILTDAFLAELCTRLGQRSRIVYAHY